MLFRTNVLLAMLKKNKIGVTLLDIDLFKVMRLIIRNLFKFKINSIHDEN